jgi:hypothetical protein
MSDFVQDVLLLGVNKIDSKLDIYAAVMPLISKVMYILTITLLKPTFGIELYAHHPATFNLLIVKTIIDGLAISGISANAAKYGNKYSVNVGLMKGILYAFFTFLIPTLFMSSLLSSKSRIVNLLVGIMFIYILELLVNGFSYYYIKHVTKLKKTSQVDTIVHDKTD